MENPSVWVFLKEESDDCTLYRSHFPTNTSMQIKRGDLGSRQRLEPRVLLKKSSLSCKARNITKDKSNDLTEVYLKCKPKRPAEIAREQEQTANQSHVLVLNIS